MNLNEVDYLLYPFPPPPTKLHLEEKLIPETLKHIVQSKYRLPEEQYYRLETEIINVAAYLLLSVFLA